MYRYEIHCHTAPVSACAKASPEDTVRFYRSLDYDGVFITNHFIDGNINPEARGLPYPEQIEYFCRDFRRAEDEGRRAGIKVFFGIELAYGGTDFLVFGLGPDWFLAHPEIVGMSKTEELLMMRDDGAFIIQAHPYREAYYIDHIRLYPRCVEGVEIVNSCQSDSANQMARLYARHYGLIETVGSDNHWAGDVGEELMKRGMRPEIASMASEEAVESVDDLIVQLRTGRMHPEIVRLSV